MSTMMMERSAQQCTTVYGAPAPGQAQSNVCILPRCTAKFEKCQGGFKITCKCDDEVACGALQNLCKMLQGGACNCCCTWNGTTVFQCNLCCGHTTCEMTKDGCCITCKSGDKACCDMLQACCDCLAACCQNGCTCCISFGSTPVCCCTC